MKILVVGSGGREHALCWKLRQSGNVEKVYCAPGNAGISADAECVDIKAEDIAGLADFAAKEKIGLTVVGPELPLCDGIVDVFMAKGLKVFGPDKSSARLEGSKEFAKKFMQRHGIPTARAEVFTAEKPASEYIRGEFARGCGGIVVKADGLAAGKGVIVAQGLDEALSAVSRCFGGAFGSAGSTVVVEEMLVGEEASILALTDGKTITALASSQDHKRALDGDQGPNTGGMGAYSPAPSVTPEVMDEIESNILRPFLKGIQSEKLYYRGIIYAGIMLTKDGAKVLEFNVRFGDPETQAVLARLDSDLADAMLKTAEGRLEQAELAWSKEPSVCVVMVSGGYPGSYEKGFPIRGLEDAAEAGATVFHAGTSLKDGNIVNNGGRVLGVTARGTTISDAVKKAYAAAARIRWDKCFYRKDIAHRALLKK